MAEKRTLTFWGSFILGFGLLGAFDGIIFHQLLQWHSVYMHTDLQGQIISDGLFHVFTTIALVWGRLHFGGLEVLIALNEENAFFCQGYSSMAERLILLKVSSTIIFCESTT